MARSKAGSSGLPLAELIDRRMVELGLTLEALARRVRVASRNQARPTPSLVNHWRHGDVTPTPGNLRLLAQALDMDPMETAVLAEVQRKGDDVERRRFMASVAATAIAPMVTADLWYKGFAAAIGDRPSADDWAERVEVYGADYMSVGAAELQPRLAADLVVLQAQLDSPVHWAVASKLLALYAKTTPGAENSSRWYGLAALAADRSEDRPTRVWVRGRAALALAYEGAALDVAERLADEALSLSCQPSLGRLNAFTAKAHVLAFRGERTGAYATFEQARWVFEAAGSDEQVSDYAVPEWRFHTFASMLLSRMGDERRAVREQEAADRARPLELARFATHIELHRGLMLVRSGDVAGGLDYARRAMARLPVERHSLTLRLLLAEVERAAS
jgi:transcriptional regulator with XRE-family HTH domain